MSWASGLSNGQPRARRGRSPSPPPSPPFAFIRSGRRGGKGIMGMGRLGVLGTGIFLVDVVTGKSARLEEGIVASRRKWPDEVPKN